MRRMKVDIYEGIIWILLVWIVFQDFILAIFYHVTGSKMLTNLLFYSKDILMVILFGWALIRNRLFNRKLLIWELAYLCIFLFATINALKNAGLGLSQMLPSMRGILLLPIFVFIGYGIGNKKKFRDNMVKKYGFFLGIIAIFGILEFFMDAFIGTRDFWLNTVEIGKFMIDIKGQAARLIMGLPGNFYGNYGKGFFTQKRLVSFWGGPLTAAYALSMPCIFYFVQLLEEPKERIGYVRMSKLKKMFFFLICYGAIVLSFTRAMILLVTFFLVIYYFKKTKNYKYLLGGIPIVLVIGVRYFEKIFHYIYDSSAIGHINGIVGAITSITFLGDGIGTFGINSIQGTESTYLTVLGQLGVIGLLVYAVGFLLPIYCYKRFVVKDKLDWISVSVILCTLVYGGSGIISEQLTAYTTIAPFFILLGCELGYLLENDRIWQKFGGYYEDRNCTGKLQWNKVPE